jgi:circadian clock protein KaiB
MGESKNSTREEFILKLYVSGASPNSLRAIHNLKAICEEHLKDNYNLEIIDVYQDAALSVSEQIVALPLLIKKMPLPQRRLIGDMSDTEKVLIGLGVVN